MIKKKQVMKKVFTLILTLLTVSNALSFDNKKWNSSIDSCTIQVRITDPEESPFGLVLEIVNVEVYNQNSGWITLNDYQQSISSLSFTKGDKSLLANSIIPSGNYTKIRLTFGNTNAIYSDLATTDLVIESRNNQQVEININQLITANDTNEVLIHFDLSTSITQTNEEYILRPVFEEINDPATLDFEVISDLSSNLTSH